MPRKLYALLLVCIMTATAAAAQAERSYFGARLGMNVTFPTGSENTYGTGAGFHAGVIYHRALRNHIFVEPGLFYSQASMSNRHPFEYDNFMFNGTATTYSLHIPVYVGYTFHPSENFALDLSTGPALNINLAARQGFDPNFDAPMPIPSKKRIDMLQHGWKRVDGLWGIKLSMNFSDSYYLGISGEVSFTPLARYGNGDKKIKIHRNSVAITFGYNF